ncbi:MAG: hypothetical protein RL596_1330 [Bacteroidota bacterium]
MLFTAPLYSQQKQVTFIAQEITIAQNALNWQRDTTDASFIKWPKSISGNNTTFSAIGYTAQFTLINKRGTDADLLLEFPRWGLIQVIATTRNNTDTLFTGCLLPLQVRNFQSNTIAVRFPLLQNDSIQFHISCYPYYSIFLPKKFDIKIKQTVDFEKKDKQRVLWQSMFLGIILIMTLYNLFIYLGVKDISYLYFVLSIMGLGLYLTFYYGFGIEYLWPKAPRWDTFCYTIIVPLTNISRLLFTKTYLNTSVFMPAFNKVVNIFIYLLFSLTGFGCIIFLFDIDLLIPLLDIIGISGIFVYILMLVTGLNAFYIHKYHPAKYFIQANILLVIGAILFIVRELGALPDNFITRYFVQLGFAVQVILFALGLANRYNQTKQELAREMLERETLALEKEREKKELIEKQKEELAIQVHQQTKDLTLQNLKLAETISQLEESQQKLTQLNNVKDKLFSIISHDLRNPLASMQSFLKLITAHHEKLNEQEKERLIKEAQNSLDYLNQLLYNLLQWSKSQMHMLEFRPQSIDIQTAFEKSIRLVYLQAHMKQVKIHVDIEAHLTVQADSEMFDFILRNLLSNAIKFCNKKGEILATAYSQNSNICIEVRDTGIGMSEHTVQEILASNITGSKRGTSKERGTGLGLLICKEFIEVHQGLLIIHSAIHKGTTVIVQFPK